MVAERDSRGRRNRLEPISTGKRIQLTERDKVWLEALARHGPLASSFLLQFAKHLGVNKKRAQERLTDLFNENNTPNRSPYLSRPPQQFETLDSRYNQLVYDLTKGARRAMKTDGIVPQSSGGPWRHRFMVSSVTASIELAIAERDDLNFISQSDILKRAGTTLSVEVSIPSHNWPIKLVPDSLFGIEYLTKNGSLFRFFVVEADRATEPLTSKNFNRKSAQRSLQTYQAYIGEGLYKKHLALTAPLLVLNVFSEAARAEKVRQLYEREAGSVSYQLFQSWEDFAPPFRPPQPNLELAHERWLRPGAIPVVINCR